MGKSPTHPPFICNAQGQRVTRVEDEVITHFYYTGSALLFTTVNEYVLQTQNILDPTGTIVAGRRFEGQAETGQDPYAEDYFFYRYDIRGSVTTIVDGEGAVVKSYDYDEFGVTTSTGGAFFNEVTFTGSISDASGLLYMNARYYNPTTARFLSQDSYSGNPYDPWTQHLYAYCNNNPVNMIDPTGHVAVRATAVYVNFGDGEKTIGTASEDEASLPEIVGNIKVGIWGEPNTYADRGQGNGVIMVRMVVQMWTMTNQTLMVQRAGIIILGGGMRTTRLSGLKNRPKPTHGRPVKSLLRLFLGTESHSALLCF